MPPPPGPPPQRQWSRTAAQPSRTTRSLLHDLLEPPAACGRGTVRCTLLVLGLALLGGALLGRESMGALQQRLLDDVTRTPAVSCRGGHCEPVQAAKVALVDAVRQRLGPKLQQGLPLRRPAAEIVRSIRSASWHPSLKVGPGGVAEIEAVDMSAELFRRFLHLNEPLVIRQLPELADLADRWTDDVLRERAGEVPVRVERSRSARFGYQDSNWRIEKDTLLYRSFLDQYLREGTENPYAATEMPQELALDVALPLWAVGSRAVTKKSWHTLRQMISNATATNLYMWHGGGSRLSLLHADRAENLLMLVAGEKRLTLFHGDHGPELAEDIWHIDKISAINISNPQPPLPRSSSALERYRRYTQRVAALKLQAVLRPGDALYLPMQCFHEVESVGRTIGLSLWFDYHGLRKTFGENNQGGGFSSREVLSVLLGGHHDDYEKRNKDEDAPEEDSGSVRTVLASLGGCLWADPINTCTDFQAAAVALQRLQGDESK